MEVCVPSSKSSCLKGGSLTNPLKTTQNTSTYVSVSDLQTRLNEVLIKGIDVKISGKNTISNVVWGNEVKEKDSDTNKSADSASEKYPSKYSAFLPVWEPGSSLDGSLFKEKREGDTTDAANFLSQSCLQSRSMPSSPKLLSALKGSREKLGMLPKNRSVTWAPDVYDPVPTSVSHVPSSKNQSCNYHRGHGKRKNKQKRGAKSSRSSKGREKKQTRENVGMSLLKPILDDDLGKAAFTEPEGGSAVGS